MANRGPFGWYDAGREEIVRRLVDGRYSARKAAHTLAVYILSEDSLKSALARSWGMIIAASREFPTAHESLAQVLVELAKLGPAYDRNGKQVTVWSMKVWDDLPMFGWEINDEFNGFGGPCEPNGPAERRTNGLDLQGAISLWYNVNSFTAHLNKTGTTPDFMIYCLIAFKKALEHPYENLTELRWWVPGAAAWIFIDARRIYDADKSVYVGNVGSGPLWDGEQGFLKERWAFWKERFRVIANTEGVHQSTQDTAKEAAEQMDQIETARVDERVDRTESTQSVQDSPMSNELRMLMGSPNMAN